MPSRPDPRRLAELAAKKARRDARLQKAGTNSTPTTETITMSKDNTEVIHGIAAKKFDRIVRGLQSTAQRAADATTENASEWKGAKDQGVNNKALKLCLSLDRMASDKRTDFLKAFDAYRYDYFKGWDAQPDMFEQAVAAHPAAQVETVGDDAEPEPLPLFETEGDGVQAARGEEEETVDGPGADWAADPVNAADDAEFDNAGQWFNDGKAAGGAGAPAEANPFEDGTLAASTWEKGRVDGAAAEVDHYKAGWAAHKAGAALDANPGEAGSDAYTDWAKGWSERDKKQARTVKKAAEQVVEPEAADDAEGETGGAEIVQFVPGMVADTAAVAAAG